MSKHLRIFLLWLSLTVLFGAVLTGSTYAQGGGDYPEGVDPEDVNTIANQLSPSFDDQPLSDCTTEQCKTWLMEIAGYLAEGKSSQEILTIFADEYGQDILISSTGLSGDEYPAGVDPNAVYEVSREMYCDVCQGVPLADCPSQQCRAWREEIADYLLEGKNEEEIFDIMGERYGEKISGTPLTASSQRITDWVPMILIAALGVLTVFWMTRMSKGHQTKAFRVAGEAGTLLDLDNRPVPDNVDQTYLERFLSLLNEDK